MEIINNRYRIKELLKQDKHVTTYSVYDMRDDNRVILFNLLNSEYLPKSIIDFFTKRFLDVKGLTSKHIIRNHCFNTISYIDNKRQMERPYFFTAEYVPNSEDFFSVCKGLPFRKQLDYFVELCKAVYYLHLKGFVHGALNRDTIRMVKEDEGYQVLLKDIASVKIDKLFQAEKPAYSFFKSPKVSAGMGESIESDMYSLGLILLALLTQNPAMKKPSEALSLLREETSEQAVFVPIAEKLLNTENKSAYPSLYEFVMEINKTLHTAYSLVNLDEFKGLNLYTKLVGRNNEVNLISKAYEKMISYQANKRIFLVQGSTGIGKTRFLRELNFLFDLSKASVYASFSLNSLANNSKQMWIDVLRRVIMDADHQTVEKYSAELTKYFPELEDKATSVHYLKEKNTKYRLLNRIAGFISESIQSQPAVMIIDNIHLADDFTIDTFHYLCTEVLVNTNLTLVFSFEDSEVSWSSGAIDFIRNMKKRMDSETIRLEHLDEMQTGKMIQSILSMSFVPKNLARRIYGQSYGNPLFVTEIMKDLFSRNVIHVNEDTGRWNIELPEEKNYSLLELPNSVEQALVNQLKDINPFSMDILKSISIFSMPVSGHVMENFITIDRELDNRLEDLVRIGVLQRLIDDNAYLYDFRSQVLKKIVYDKMSASEKVEKHQKAAVLLEDNVDIKSARDLDELIFHHREANHLEKARMYYRINADKMKSAQNTKAQIENLTNALEITENNQERTTILIEIGELFADTGDIPLALEYLHDAERLALEELNAKLIIDSYVKLASVYSLVYNNEKVVMYLDKLKVKLENYPDEEASIEIKRMQALLLLDENKLSEAKEQLLDVVASCGTRFPKIKGNAYRTLGFIYGHLGKVEDALVSYQESLELMEAIHYTRGVLFALNNIGADYAEVYEDYDKAMEYYLQVKNLSEEYGIYTSEVYALINIADSYLNKYDFETASEHYNHALTRAIRYNMGQEKFMILNYLTQVSLERNHFTDALEYFNRLKRDVEENPNKGFDIGEFYSTCAKLYQTLGNYQEADRYNQMIISFHSEHENLMKYTATMKVLINQLRESNHAEDQFLTEYIRKIAEKITNKPINIESLCEAIYYLCQKGKYKLAKELLTKVDNYIGEDMPDRLMAIYMHAKGATLFEDRIENSISHFEKALELAKKSKSKELVSRITSDLAGCYFTMEEYYDAANYYLESSEGIKDLLRQLPEAYQLDFINGRNFAIGFYRLEFIRRWISINKESLNEVANFKVTSLEALEVMLDTNHINAFMKNQQFMQYISHHYMTQLSGEILQLQDILKNLDSDPMLNLDMIGKYLAGGTLATKALIIAEERGQKLEVLSAVNESGKLPEGLSIFNRVRASLQPILLTENIKQENANHNLLPDNMRAVLCYPIVKRNSGQLENQPFLLGYIYLETDKIVHNFNQKGLEMCSELGSLLGLVLEKRQLKQSASIDRLTGALTRKYLEDALQNTVDFSRKSGKEFSIIMFDLDRFKGVNDRYGHQIGDRVLKKVSSIILDMLDEPCVFGRYGGEEFIIILPSTSIGKAQILAEKLRKNVESKKLLGDKHDVTISIGMASYPENGDSVRELVLKADQALYVAKESGRNNAQIWRKDFENKVKPANKLTGIMSGDEIRDARNVLALVELIQITNKELTIPDKIYQFLGRMIEIMEAQYGYIFVSEADSIMQAFGRKAQEEEWVEQDTYNQQLVHDVIQNGNGVYTIDWETTDKINLVNGLPDWDSVLATPILSEGKIMGVIYLSVPARLKEFGADELNVLNVYSDLVAGIIK